MSGYASRGVDSHESGDFTFNCTLWLIPAGMILLAVLVVVCWLSATASLTREMERKQTLGAEAVSVPLSAFQAQEDSSLRSYGMKDGGMAQIPIDRAMKLMVMESIGPNPADSAPAKAK
jgi:hypothetical protein